MRASHVWTFCPWPTCPPHRLPRCWCLVQAAPLLGPCCAACSLRMYNSLVERCFKDCIETFRRKDLDSTEEKVHTHCSALFSLPLFPTHCSAC